MLSLTKTRHQPRNAGRNRKAAELAKVQAKTNFERRPYSSRDEFEKRNADISGNALQIAGAEFSFETVGNEHVGGSAGYIALNIVVPKEPI
jgi:hypothetical protein